MPAGHPAYPVIHLAYRACLTYLLLINQEPTFIEITFNSIFLLTNSLQGVARGNRLNVGNGSTMVLTHLQRPYKRILLKISGEILMGDQEFGINQSACQNLAKALLILQKHLEVAVVIGGGNIFRGINLESSGIQRSAGDEMGMLATLINGISLQQALQALGGDSKIMSAIECPRVAELYNWKNAVDSVSKGTLLIFVGGTGNPYFTTDSAAALRACEIGADLLVKATKVDGIYDKDPIKFADAVKYDSVTYSQALSEELGIMDATAIALCRNNSLPIFVFNMQRFLDNPELGHLLFDKNHGTFVNDDTHS